jgi:hypothetical protein
MQTLKTILMTLTELSGRTNNPTIQVPRFEKIPLPAFIPPVPPTDAPVVPIRNLKVLEQFADENKSLVFRYIFKKLKSAIKTDATDVVLFVLPTVNHTVRIIRAEYIKALVKMIDHYTESEEYELIPPCRQLIQQCHINELIRKTTI